jgi:hypothetical protein
MVDIAAAAAARLRALSNGTWKRRKLGTDLV